MKLLPLALTEPRVTPLAIRFNRRIGRFKRIATRRGEFRSHRPAVPGTDNQSFSLKLRQEHLHRLRCYAHELREVRARNSRCLLHEDEQRPLRAGRDRPSHKRRLETRLIKEMRPRNQLRDRRQGLGARGARR